ncbi:MAG: DUF2783 domain-containing protein [Planktomarina sp.]
MLDDNFYAKLLAAHKGLTDDQSQALNARLVLLLSNEIADLSKLEAIFDKALKYQNTL